MSYINVTIKMEPGKPQQRQPRIIFACDALHYTSTGGVQRMQVVLTKLDLLIQRRDVLMRVIDLRELEALGARGGMDPSLRAILPRVTPAR